MAAALAASLPVDCGKWRHSGGRPSCLDLVTAWRAQLAAQPAVLADWQGSFTLAHAVEQTAASSITNWPNSRAGLIEPGYNLVICQYNA